MGNPQRFELLEELGQGREGILHRAKDLELGGECAVKLRRLPASWGPQDLAAAERQVGLVARLARPDLVAVKDVFAADSFLWLVMEVVEGESLDRRLKRRPPLAPLEVLELGRKAARALAAAHGGGLIHRDLKPWDLFLLPGGRLKIGGFGLPANMIRTGGEDASFRPPEQWRNGPLDVRSDLYALAGILFLCLTGRYPFEGKDPVVIAHQTLTEDPPFPSRFRPELAPEFDRVFGKALARNPEDRFPDGEALAEAIDDLVPLVPEEGSPSVIAPAQAPSVPAAAQAKKPFNWKVVAQGLAAMILVLVLAFGIKQLAGGGSKRAAKGQKAPVSSATPPAAARLVPEAPVAVPAPAPPQPEPAPPAASQPVTSHQLQPAAASTRLPKPKPQTEPVSTQPAAPVPSAPSQPAPEPPPPPLPPEPGRAIVELRHPLESGQLEIIVGGQVLKSVALGKDGGTIGTILEIAPGSHQVTLRIKSPQVPNGAELTWDEQWEPGARRMLKLVLIQQKGTWLLEQQGSRGQ